MTIFRRVREWQASIPGRSRGLAAWLAVLLTGCQAEPDYLRLGGSTMGTYYQVTARCPADPTERIEATLAEVNAQMSTYLPDSELSRLNRAPLEQWLPVSAPLAEVLAAAAELGQRSHGAFDVTVGPLVDLWGFGAGSSRDASRVPDAAALALARERVGMHHVEISRDPPRVRRHADVSIDLSAIAKGHGVDRVFDELGAMGCSDRLVDIGGEVRTRGSGPSGAGWRIGIEVPDPDSQGGVQRVVSPGDGALATSGDYRNFFEADGRRYSHTIDPRTGRPITHGLAAVTVAHPLAMWADGWATALNVLGPEAGFELAVDQGLPALFIVRGESGFQERYTDAFGALLAELPGPAAAQQEGTTKEDR